ncbi:MAG: hypothetical protein N2663_06305 [Chlorobi bacterium]|nr:hypothetical protein [Chlorobiota bacterium]
MQNTVEKQSYAVSWFLTAIVLCTAVLVAAYLWNRKLAVTAVQCEGWQFVAREYRDSVESVLLHAATDEAQNNMLDLERLVLHYPFVGAATVRRVGSTLVVSITERIPIGIVRSTNNGMSWLFGDTSVTPYYPYYVRCNVPIVIVADPAHIAKAVTVVSTLQHYRLVNAACSEVFIEPTGVRLVLSSAAEVLLGEATELENKFERLEWLLGSSWITPAVERIDVRWQQRILLWPTSGVTSQIAAS